MSKQIFKTGIPPDILFDLLEQICVKTETYYIVDHSAYKKMKFHNLHESFLKSIIDYLLIRNLDIN